MAENKKSFVAYVDWKNIFTMLSDTEAGQLIKHLLAYVNDENLELEDRYLKLAFEPIKMQLERDLEKYEKVKERRSEAGKKGGLKSGESRKQIEANEANASLVKQNEANEAVNDNDTVTVNDNVILLEKETKAFDFKKKLIESGAAKILIEDWLKVRKTKKATNTETALNLFLTEVDKSGKSLNDVLTICIGQSWSGFKSSWKIEQNGQQQNKSSPAGFASNR